MSKILSNLGVKAFDLQEYFAFNFSTKYDSSHLYPGQMAEKVLNFLLNSLEANETRLLESSPPLKQVPTSTSLRSINSID